MSDQTNDKIRNEILSLLEEELYYRKNPGEYKDPVFNGTPESISNVRVMEALQNNYAQNIQRGGSVSSVNSFCPGKLDMLKHQMEMPLYDAIQGSIARYNYYQEFTEKQKNKI